MKSVLDLSFTAASLVAAGTVKVDPKEGGHRSASSITIVATLTGLTGGTLDVYIQDSQDGATWYDFCHFAQVAAGAAAATFDYVPALNDKFVTLGAPSTDPATPTPGIAVATGRGGHPFNYLRAVAVAGAGTSAGAAQSIKVFCQ